MRVGTATTVSTLLRHVCLFFKILHYKKLSLCTENRSHYILYYFPHLFTILQYFPPCFLFLWSVCSTESAEVAWFAHVFNSLSELLSYHQICLQVTILFLKNILFSLSRLSCVLCSRSTFSEADKDKLNRQKQTDVLLSMDQKPAGMNS